MQNVQDLLTIDPEDWSMGGMTTVTLTDRLTTFSSRVGWLPYGPRRWKEVGLHCGGWTLKMWVLERLDVAEIYIVVFVWAHFLLRQ